MKPQGGSAASPEAELGLARELVSSTSPWMAQSKDTQALEDEGSPDPWAKCVRALLSRHNVSSRKYGRVISEVLGMQYMAGYRRAWGKHPWRSDELEKIASHFGETVSQMLEPLLSQATEPAVLLIGSLQIKCDAVLGEMLTPPLNHQLVAIGGLETWLIVPGSEVARTAREVRKLILHPSAPSDAGSNGGGS